MLEVSTAFIDFEHLIIPDRITFPTMALGWSVRWRFLKRRQESHLLRLSIRFYPAGVWAGDVGCVVSREKILPPDASGWAGRQIHRGAWRLSSGRSPRSDIADRLVAGTLIGSRAIGAGEIFIEFAVPFGSFLAAATCIWIIGDSFILYWFDKLLQPSP